MFVDFYNKVEIIIAKCETCTSVSDKPPKQNYLLGRTYWDKSTPSRAKIDLSVQKVEPSMLGYRILDC